MGIDKIKNGLWNAPIKNLRMNELKIISEARVICTTLSTGAG